MVSRMDRLVDDQKENMVSWVSLKVQLLVKT